MDALEKKLPARQKALAVVFCLIRQPHSKVVYQLSVPNANAILNCRVTLSESNNTDPGKFSRHSMTQHERWIPEAELRRQPQYPRLQILT